MHRLATTTAVLILAGLPISAQAQVTVPAIRVIGASDPLIGAPGHQAEIIGQAITDGQGRVGFGGRDSGNTFHYIWYDGQVIFKDTTISGHTVSANDIANGIADNGGFLAGGYYDGLQAAWSDHGLIIKQLDAAPGVLNEFIREIRSPGMTPAGVGFFIAQTSRQELDPRHSTFYRVVNTASPVVEPLMSSEKTYAGVKLGQNAFSISRAYDIADNGTTYINRVSLDSGGTGIILTNGATRTLVARTNTFIPGSTTEKYTDLHFPSTNNRGDFLIPAETDGNVQADEIIVYNNKVVLREGDYVDGAMMGSVTDQHMRVFTSSVDNYGYVAFIVNSEGGGYLMYGPGEELRASQILLSEGDQLDFDGDGVCDAVLDYFPPVWESLHAIDLADDGMIYLQVQVTYCQRSLPEAAIIGIKRRCAADWDNSDFIDTEDFDAFVMDFIAGDADADNNGFTDTDDFDFFVRAFERGC